MEVSLEFQEAHRTGHGVETAGIDDVYSVEGSDVSVSGPHSLHELIHTEEASVTRGFQYMTHRLVLRCYSDRGYKGL